MKARAKSTRRIPTLKPTKAKPQPPTESERNATLREQLAARDARISEQQREIERLTNLAYSNGQVAQRVRDRLVEQATHNRRLLAEKDALVRNQAVLRGEAERLRRILHRHIEREVLGPAGQAPVFDGKGHARHPV